jgi:hypothetical protein
MVWLPAIAVDIPITALPPDNGVVANAAPPSRNCTLPVADAGDTDAVHVTDCPYADGDILVVRLVVVTMALTVSLRFAETAAE